MRRTRGLAGALALAAAALAAAARADSTCYRYREVDARVDPGGSAFVCRCKLTLLGFKLGKDTVPCQQYVIKYPAHTECLDETWDVSDCEPGGKKDVKIIWFRCTCSCCGPSVDVKGTEICLGSPQAECKRKRKDKIGTVEDMDVVPCE